MSAMESSQPENEIDHEFLPFLRVYKGGRVERLVATDFSPASIDPQTGVSSKDVKISPNSGVSARLYLPNLTHINHKLPLLIYFHGGGFLVASPFASIYHHHLNSIVAEANVIAVSVDYRLAPEHPIPVCYDDSWAALQWAFSHSSGHRDGSDQTEPWLTNHADFDRVFFAGDSAGANIAHNLAMRVRAELGVELLGVALLHPYFWGSDPIGSESTEPIKKAFVDRVWPYVCPSNPNHDDPRINPVVADSPSLVGLGCSRVLVFVAEKDILRDRGWLYYEELGKSGWMGVVKIKEAKEEDHVFHLLKPESEKARDLVTQLALFLNLERPPLP
ncbi:probable carboxylesterase 2 [Telopea speciosissima]|uniref:probable carboxylesterase 2 n=1 Tax=Telopea speciosissima TaxID=54955 RepID=UPI001CC61A49|nr:probable carboxylesterase 2 [Telopea speciosissima]